MIVARSGWYVQLWRSGGRSASERPDPEGTLNASQNILCHLSIFYFLNKSSKSGSYVPQIRLSPQSGVEILPQLGLCVGKNLVIPGSHGSHNDRLTLEVQGLPID